MAKNLTSNRSNPLNLDRLSIRDCTIYKRKEDGTFAPCYFRQVTYCKTGQIFLVSQHPREGKVCLMKKETIRKLLKEQEDYDAEIQKRRYKISR